MGTLLLFHMHAYMLCLNLPGCKAVLPVWYGLRWVPDAGSEEPRPLYLCHEVSSSGVADLSPICVGGPVSCSHSRVNQIVSLFLCLPVFASPWNQRDQPSAKGQKDNTEVTKPRDWDANSFHKSHEQNWLKKKKKKGRGQRMEPSSHLEWIWLPVRNVDQNLCLYRDWIACSNRSSILYSLRIPPHLPWSSLQNTCIPVGLPCPLQDQVRVWLLVEYSTPRRGLSSPAPLRGRRRLRNVIPLKLGPPF